MPADATRPGSPVRDVPVEGMHCAGCVQSVETLLGRTEGVTGVAVNFGTHRARIEGDVSLATLDASLERGGYKLGDRTTVLPAGADVEGVKSLDGVLAVSEQDGGWLVRHVDASSVIEALRAALPDGTVLETEDDPRTRRLVQSERAWRARFYLAAPLAGYLMLAAMTSWIPAPWSDGVVQAVFAGFVVFGAGWPILAGAAKAVRHGRADMDVLIALGTLVAFGASVGALVGVIDGPLYFDASAMIMMFVCLGRWLEARARRSTGSAVDHLMRLEPETALVIDGEETEPREVPVSRLLVGDRVMVRPGGRFPADGTVRSGSSRVDESLLTGESDGVLREAGDAVVAGATNGTGALEVEVTAVGGDTALRRIAAWVERAQAQPAPVARVADRVAGVFVPVVLVIAAVTFLGWWLGAGAADVGVSAAIAVLVIACPCALGLATPVAIVVGTGRAAREGILIEGGGAIERAAHVRTVVFDKTGTLTGTGGMRCVGVHAVGAEADGPYGDDLTSLIAAVAGVEVHSEHPLAAATVAFAHREGIDPAEAREVEAVPGAGLRGVVDEHVFLVGSPAWFEDQGIDARVLAVPMDAARQRGRSVVLVARDGAFVGFVAFETVQDVDARSTIAALTAMGVESRILSGDAPEAVAQMATHLGIPPEHAEARVTPEGKASYVEGLSQVAMVGDGINDAPALASADVGIAVGSATDVAGAAADIALLGDGLHGVPNALALCRLTLRTIHQNLGWAFGYNALAIPLAAFGILPPMAAAAAMALSSVSVVLNSLRLRQAPLGPGTFSKAS